MPLSSPFHRSALVTVLCLAAAAAIAFYPPDATARDLGRKGGEHGIAATHGKGDSRTRSAN